MADRKGSSAVNRPHVVIEGHRWNVHDECRIVANGGDVFVFVGDDALIVFTRDQACTFADALLDAVVAL